MDLAPCTGRLSLSNRIFDEGPLQPIDSRLSRPVNLDLRTLRKKVSDIRGTLMLQISA